MLISDNNEVTIVKIAICEDEEIYSDRLRGAVEKYFSGRKILTDISVFTDGKPLVSDYENGSRYDILFLDIQLESSDGMNIAARLREIDSEAVMIFVTGIENRAVEGYAVSAFDYIVKSSLDSRLSEVLDRFMSEREKSFITVQTLSGDAEVISCADIVYMESDGRGTAVNTTNGVIKSSQPVGKTVLTLPEGRFTEIHKSIFVQTTKIKRVGSDTVEMFNGVILPMSRRKRKQVLTAVMTAVKGGLK